MFEAEARRSPPAEPPVRWPRAPSWRVSRKPNLRMASPRSGPAPGHGAEAPQFLAFLISG